MPTRMRPQRGLPDRYRNISCHIRRLRVVAQISTKKFNPHGSTGSPSWPRRPWAPRWPIFSTVRSVSATPAARRSCWLASWLRWRSGISRSARSMSKPSRRRGWKSSTGSRSRFRRRSAPLSGTGWRTTHRGLGFGGAALVFGVALAVLAAFYYWTSISRVYLFWGAFILTRPLGATVGDFLDKPHNLGGLALSRTYASAILVAAIIALIVLLSQRAVQRPSARTAT